MKNESPQTIIVHTQVNNISISIWADINEKGDLVISGQDFGVALKELFGTGDDEYEYWLTIPARGKGKLVSALVRMTNAKEPATQRITPVDKDELLLRLLVGVYIGNVNIIEDLKKVLIANNIQFKFSNY